jgi:hypothetical protein
VLNTSLSTVQKWEDREQGAGRPFAQAAPCREGQGLTGGCLSARSCAARSEARSKAQSGGVGREVSR